ncbi:hypothetical protein [Pseudomonas oryzae]|uniref:hypothetical protein n=1 Tax=Pseudomonas oryzae TaxID=1392877 RepID=UPI00155FEFBF|nr:hypothetical protein [Pseudomonas oryzae]
MTFGERYFEIALSQKAGSIYAELFFSIQQYDARHSTPTNSTSWTYSKNIIAMTDANQPFLASGTVGRGLRHDIRQNLSV